MKTLAVVRYLWRSRCLSLADKTCYSTAVPPAGLNRFSLAIDRSPCEIQRDLPVRYSASVYHEQCILACNKAIALRLSLEHAPVHQDCKRHLSIHSATTQFSSGFKVLSTGCSKICGISTPLSSSTFRGYARAAGSSSNIASVNQGSDVAVGPNSATSDVPRVELGASEAGNWPESVPSGLNSVLEFAKQMEVRALDAMHGVIDPFSAGAIDTLLSASIALTACACAWLILPKVLRALHRYVEQGPTARLLGRTAQEQVPYEMSVWNAMEDPARLFVTLVAFSQLGAMVAPSTVAIHYLEQIWRGGTVVALVWFLHRWKSSAFAGVLAGRKMTQVERERYLALDKISSVGLIVLGAMALAEASGVAVQSILTVGGIGGVATAFAARDILGNALSGLSLQFSKPFSVGDTISVIVNKSRAHWRGLNAKFPLHFSSFDKLRDITTEIVEKLCTHPDVFLEQEPPRCSISNVTPTHLELLVSCNIKPTDKDGFLHVQQEILISIAQILTRNGITLGSLQSPS